MDCGVPCDAIRSHTGRGRLGQSVCTNPQSRRVVTQLCVNSVRLSTLTRDRSISISDDQINRAYAIDILMMNTKQNVLQRSTDGCDAHPSVMTLSHTTICIAFGVWIGRESLQSSVCRSIAHLTSDSLASPHNVTHMIT
jgi:hypothetical protein